MTTFLDALTATIQNGACATAIAGDSFWGLFPPVGIIDGMQEIAEKARTLACGKAPNSLPPPGNPPPFEGGQCQNIDYLVRYYTKDVNGNSIVGDSAANPSQGILRGAISGISERTTARGIREVIMTGASQFPLVLVNESLTSADRRPHEYFIVSVTRADGQPDTCGSLPTTPPGSIEEFEDILPPGAPYEDEDGNPFTLPELPIKWFPPCIGLDGISVPFEVTTPVGKICGKVGISPSLKTKTGFKPDIDIDLCPEEKQSIGIPQEDVEEFFELESFGDYGDINPNLNGGGTIPATPDKPILGVFVTSKMENSPPQNRTIVVPEDSTHQHLIVPYIALVQFGYHIETESGAVDTGWSEDYRVKFVKQFVPCPFPFGASTVRVRWERGWSGGYKLARRKSCCESCASKDPRDSLDNYDRCK